MKVLHTRLGNVDDIRTPERLTAGDSPDVQRQISRIIKDGEAKLLLDMSETTFVDSSGLGMLVAGLQDARKHNGNMVLYALRPEIVMLLELTRLDEVFPIRSDRPTAVEVLS